MALPLVPFTTPALRKWLAVGRKSLRAIPVEFHRRSAAVHLERTRRTDRVRAAEHPPGLSPPASSTSIVSVATAPSTSSFQWRYRDGSVR